MTARNGHSGITPLESETLDLLGKGLLVKDIARLHNVSPNAIEHRIANCMKQLEAKNSREMMFTWGHQQPRKRVPLQETRQSLTHKVKIYSAEGDVALFITAGLYPTGKIGEIFVPVGKQGGVLRGTLDSWARMVSVSLQWGVPLEEIIRKFKGIAFQPNGATNNTAIPNCASIIDYVVQWLELQEQP